MSNDELVAIGLAYVGAVLIYASRRRRFNRTNACGIEQFPSYGRKLVGKLGDAVLLVLGGFLALVGIIFLAQANIQSWGWIVLAPIAWFFVVGYIPGGKR